jgi:hypothetical protein
MRPVSKPPRESINRRREYYTGKSAFTSFIQDPPPTSTIRCTVIRVSGLIDHRPVKNIRQRYKKGPMSTHRALPPLKTAMNNTCGSKLPVPPLKPKKTFRSPQIQGETGLRLQSP